MAGGINVGRWLRKQFFGGKAVTVGNIIELAVREAGYKDISTLLADLAFGRVTADMLGKRLEDAALTAVKDELLVRAIQLRNEIEKL